MTPYLTLTDADTLVTGMPGLTAYNAASSGARTAALLQASDDIDGAMPYQGRPVDPSSSRQFPRIVESDGRTLAQPADDALVDPPAVWDWNDAAQAPVVPADVKLAVLHQADAILAGTREPRLAAQHDGVVYELTGTLAESYKSTPGPGVTSGLCRRAWILVRKYRLRSGRMV